MYDDYNNLALLNTKYILWKPHIGDNAGRTENSSNSVEFQIKCKQSWLEIS